MYSLCNNVRTHASGRVVPIPVMYDIIPYKFSYTVQTHVT